MCLLNLKVKLRGIAPVRQCAGHHFPSLLAINQTSSCVCTADIRSDMQEV